MSACNVRWVCGKYKVRGRSEGICAEGSGGLSDEYEVAEVAVTSDEVMVFAVRVVAFEYAVRTDGVMVMLELRDGCICVLGRRVAVSAISLSSIRVLSRKS